MYGPPRSRIPIQTSTLLSVAGGVFVLGSGMLYLLQNRMQAKVRRLPHYQETFKIISKHEDLLKTVGRPIQIGKIDLADRKVNYVDKLESKLRIPISGPLEGGFINVVAERQKEEDEFVTKQLEFESEQGSYIVYRV